MATTHDSAGGTIPQFTSTVDAAARREKRFKIVINEGSEREPPTVFIGVNGRGYQISRGEEVEVPQSVITVLKNSVQIVWTKVKDELGREKMVSRKVRRYPFTVVEEVKGATDGKTDSKATQ